MSKPAVGRQPSTVFGRRHSGGDEDDPTLLGMTLKYKVNDVIHIAKIVGHDLENMDRELEYVVSGFEIVRIQEWVHLDRERKWVKKPREWAALEKNWDQLERENYWVCINKEAQFLSIENGEADIPYTVTAAVNPVDAEKQAMLEKIKDVFQMFDKSGDGQLDHKEMKNALSQLGASTFDGSFSDEQIEGFIEDLDKSKDGQISYKEFAEWVMRGGGKEVARAIIREVTNRDARIKKTFERYDMSGDGSLDVDELHDVLKVLGTFTVTEIANILTDLDTSKDGNVSYEEFADWVKRKGGSKEINKAKAILAPCDDDGLEAVFYSFCGVGCCEMDGKSFIKVCKDCKLVDATLTETVIDLLFNNTAVKPKGKKAVSFGQFLKAIEMVAEKKGMEAKAIHTIFLECTRSIIGTKADSVRFHDDKTTYTGSHKTDGRHRLGRQNMEVEIQMPVHKKRGVKSKTPKVEADLTSHFDNTDLWKKFGADTTAGLMLKRLYAKDLVKPKPDQKSSGSSLPQMGSSMTSGFQRSSSSLNRSPPLGTRQMYRTLSLPQIRGGGFVERPVLGADDMRHSPGRSNGPRLLLSASQTSPFMRS